jgi:hypothetical protein
MADQKQGSDRDLSEGIGGGSSPAASAGATSATRTPRGMQGAAGSRSDGNGRGSSDGGTVSDQARGMAGQIFGSVRHAAEGLLDEQKDRAVDAVGGVAQVLRRTAQSLEGENEGIARYAEQAADQVERFTENIRERHLGDIVADLDDFARRQPTLFLIGAVAAGFVVGRFIASSAERSQADLGGGSARSRADYAQSRGGARTAGYGASSSSNFPGTRGNA